GRAGGPVRRGDGGAGRPGRGLGGPGRRRVGPDPAGADHLPRAGGQLRVPAKFVVPREEPWP
ncbi:unnamed protein product, partial [Heterosigma akashiwo]